MHTKSPIKVLFVCYGNLCRSPLAQAYFQSLIDHAKVQDRIQVSSSGFCPQLKGKKFHPITQDICHSEQLPLIGTSRPTTLDDLKKYDFILAMDEQNLRDLAALDTEKNCAKKNTALMLLY